jgi:signal transduction histidine kinase
MTDEVSVAGEQKYNTLIEHLNWQLEVNAALAELYKPLISPKTSIEDTTHVILVRAKRLTGSEHGYVAVIDPVTKDLVVYTLTAMMGKECKLDKNNQRIIFPIGKDGRYPKLWGHALNTLEPFYTNAPHTHPASTGPPEGHVALKRYLSLPVVLGDELVGQIGLANPDRDYTNQDLAAVRRLGEFFALAIQRKRAESELAKHREQLEELVRERTDELAAAHERLRQAQKLEAIGTLAGGIAHDFNNILGAIIGYTELAKDDIPDDSLANDNLGQVLAAAQRAKEMVLQILTFSRKTKEERKMVRFGEIIEEAVKFLRSTLPTTIDISLSIEEKLSPIQANPTQLHQVIMNISTNAAHAMRKKGGELKIELKEINHYPGGCGSGIESLAPGKYQHLVISDTGHGMSPGILKRIFEPYFTAKKIGEGTGMGLPVVHGIVKGHGGEITVDSKPGQGSTFHVFLPVIRKKETLEQEQKEEQLSPAQLGSECILFVEDEQMLRELGQKILEKLGYRVTAAANGAEALEYFQKSPDPFDLVITDMAMPQMTGLQMAKECKKIKPGIPVILCTGFSDQVDDKNFESQGIDAFAMKPLRMQEIAKIIRKVLEPK